MTDAPSPSADVQAAKDASAPASNPATRPGNAAPQVTSVGDAASRQASYYSHHVFFCTNVRQDDGSGQVRPSCGRHNADAMRDHAKKRVKQLGLAGAGRVRINNAGCLDRCEDGPCIVVYPEGVWYTYLDESDIDEIVDRHLALGEVVERLQI